MREISKIKSLKSSGSSFINLKLKKLFHFWIVAVAMHEVTSDYKDKAELNSFLVVPTSGYLKTRT